MKDAMGRLGFFRPARARRTALATATTASSCPMTRPWSVSSKATRRAPSSDDTFSTGTPVHLATTAATSASVTTTSVARMPSPASGGSSVAASPSAVAASAASASASCSKPASLRASSSTVLMVFRRVTSLDLSSAATSYFWSRTASSFFFCTSLSSACASFAASGRMLDTRSRTRAPVSSRTSMALSGKKRSVMYCEANFTQDSRASGV
mmetsp:Transcript_21764/g.48108  ORF Transcript_21764/g.48108 Transcript_21764/m.48108 type:complete len:210 (+) Transcript_21764:1006-1635(+)